MAHRTALIAAGSIAVVIVAGAVAVGANLGILDAADSHPVGKLSASTTVAATVPQPAGPAAPAIAAATPVPQQYVIKQAGTVSVTLAESALRVSDVTTLRGWTWALAQTSDSKLKVTFRHKAATYTFVATRGPGGTIVARVDHPVTKVIPAGAPAPMIIASAVAPAPAPASVPSASHHDDNGGHGGSHSDD